MAIVSKPATDEYRDGWDRVFGDRQKTRTKTCNRHRDCDAADERAKARGRVAADHCYDENCEDCFGS